MFASAQWRQETAEWLADRVDAITEDYREQLPSEWAEATRYLPRATTPQPGPFSFEATPYWREVVDNFSPSSPVQFCAVMKGAQVAATVGVLENIIGYQIDYVRTMPSLFFTADKELAEMRVDTNIVPMIQQSGLGHLIQSNDDMRANKRGLTNKKIEWSGGGYLLPLGAVNANKQRSLSAPWLLRDEVDGWPLIVGRDADPMKLTETRTNSYDQTRKILDLSTPNIAATSAIYKRFKLGDQRYWFVPCKHCGESQKLEFRKTNADTGHVYGLVWATSDDGYVVPGSAKYVCKFCGGAWTNDDKIDFMQRGEWVPTATPSRPNFRSYHLSALYAPFFARTWESIAMAWNDAWDDKENKAKDLEALQVFYNNDLGVPYEIKADKLKDHQISPHKRSEYRMGQLPGAHPEIYAGGRVQLVTMSVDVQLTWLAVEIRAHAPSADRNGYAAYTVDYFRIEGDCENVESEAWAELGRIIDTRSYTDNDGRTMRIAMTMVDASYLPDTVYAFCAQWESGVFPLRGRDKPTKSARYNEFEIKENATGTRYVLATVDVYKDRWSAVLKREWNGIDKMPRNNWSAPYDIPDKALREMAVEYKREKRDPASGRLLGTYWHRPSGARNELWDVGTYNTVALELLALDYCENELALDHLSWPDFWDEAEKGRYVEK